VLEIVPVVEFPPEMPLTSHVTLELVVPEVVAMNCCSPVSPRVTTEGEIVIVTLGRVVLPAPPHPRSELTTNIQKSANSGLRTEICFEPLKPGFALSR